MMMDESLWLNFDDDGRIDALNHPRLLLARRVFCVFVARKQSYATLTGWCGTLPAQFRDLL